MFLFYEILRVLGHQRDYTVTENYSRKKNVISQTNWLTYLNVLLTVSCSQGVGVEILITVSTVALLVPKQVKSLKS